MRERSEMILADLIQIRAEQRPEERNHRDNSDVPLFPSAEPSSSPQDGTIECKQRPDGC